MAKPLRKNENASTRAGVDSHNIVPCGYVSSEAVHLLVTAGDDSRGTFSIHLAFPKH